MPEIQDSYQFNSQVKALGQQRKGEGWTLTVDWKLPGSQYELVLYGQDWADVEGLAVAKTAYFDIAKGSLKQDKSGKYASDYFWNLTTVSEPQASTRPAPQEPGPASQDPPKEYRQPTSQDEYRRSKEEMRYTECLKVAAISFGPERDAWQDAFPIITNRADDLYNYLVEWESGRLPGTPAEAPSVPAQPPQAQKLNPGVIKQRIIDGPLKQWNDDVMNGAREGQMLTVKLLAQWAKAKHDLDLDDLTRDQSIIVANAIANGLVK